MSMGPIEFEPLLTACEHGLRDLIAQLDDPGVPVEQLEAARRRWDGNLERFLDALAQVTLIDEPGRVSLTKRIERLSALCALVRRRTEEERDVVLEAGERARAEQERLRAHGSDTETAGDCCDFSG